jgi:hypothetical protein
VTTFDELIGAEPAGTERERLRSVHDMLVEAGPPPELTPELASGPTLAMTLGRRARAKSRRRRMLLPAVAAAMLVVLVVSFATARNSDGSLAIPLTGTPKAPNAVGTLIVLKPTKTTQPMKIEVQGLKPGQYGVYLVHQGRSWEKCGTFVVRDLAGGRTTSMDSPYRAKPGDTWVVAPLTAKGHGATVLRPATA